MVLIGAGCAGELRIRCDGCQRMTRDIHFRENIYKLVFCISHQLFDIILSIKATEIAWLFRTRDRESAKTSFKVYIPCPYFCQFWETFYFNAPALVVGEVYKAEIIIIFR